MNITPIRGLNPYSSKWTIQCRVVGKGEIRSWDKGPTNQGKLFSATLLDSEDMEIKATFFRDGVDKFHHFIDVGKVYNFSNGQIKLANKKFNSTNCDYEITFNATAEVTESESESIKTVSINPTPIANLDPQQLSITDISGVVMSWDEIQTFTSKAGREITKLDIQIADKSNCMIRCTVFGEKCKVVEDRLKQANASFLKVEKNPNVSYDQLVVVAIKGVRVSDYSGCSLSLLPSSEIYFNLDSPETKAVIEWVRTGVDKNSFRNKSDSVTSQGNKATSFNDRKSLHFIDALEEVAEEKGEYFTVKGTISVIRKNTISYPACPEESSNKKVVEQPDGSYYCEATGKSYQDCQHRYILNMEIADHTGSLWVTAFNDDGEKIIGHTANSLNDIRNTNEELFESILLQATFEEWMFKIRVKNEIYQEEGKKRCTLVSAVKINYDEETKQIAEYLQQFN